MDKCNGPKLRVSASCLCCLHERSEHYVAQGDSGHRVSCAHPDGRGLIGDTTWMTPKWCPLLPEAKRQLAATLTEEAT